MYIPDYIESEEYIDDHDDDMDDDSSDSFAMSLFFAAISTGII